VVDRKDAWPELFELEGFFGTMAEFAPGRDAEYWFHQGVCFNKSIGDERVWCELLPFDGQLAFRWSVAGADCLDLKLQFVRQLEIRRDAGGERLACFVREGGLDQCFTFALYPVRLQVATALPA